MKDDSKRQGTKDCNEKESKVSSRTNKNNAARNDNSNSRSRNNKGRSNTNTKGNSNRYKSNDNDASWYMRYPELARDASQIPFTTPLGKYPDVNVNSGSISTSTAAFTVPGIMRVDWIPTIGQSTHENSPINIVARELYSFIRHANSGHANYDSPDLMMYMIAMDSLYSFYSAMVRAYGVIMLYSGMNRYMPSELVTQMGFNFDDLSSNLAQFRWVINQAAYKLTALYVPAGMSYYERHIWMNSGVYVDSSSVKAQTYVFRQKAYYKYTADSGTGYVATLKYTPVWSNMTVTQCANFFNSLLNPILADEDMNIISGDMLRAFGANNLFTVSPISEDYVVVPTYSQEVLSQIQNLTIMGDPDTKSSTNPGYYADIIQRVKTTTFTPGVYQNLTFTSPVTQKTSSAPYGYNYVVLDKLVTMLQDVPSSEEILVATRLSNICETFDIEDYIPEENTIRSIYSNHKNISTEVVTGISVSYVLSNGTFTQVDVPQSLVYRSDAIMAADTMTNYNTILTVLSAFDWHPFMYLFHTVGSNTKLQLDGNLIETNNFTVLSKTDLDRLHETALISEFYIPDVRKLSSNPMK